MPNIFLVATDKPHIKSVKLRGKFIGKLDSSGAGTFLTWRSKLHLIKNRYFGIPVDLLEDERIKFDRIIFFYNEIERYDSSREYFRKKGIEFLAGIDKLKIVPLDELNMRTLHKFESEVCKNE